MHLSRDAKKWVLIGWVLFLALALFHPLVLDALGKDHPPNCPLCAVYSSYNIVLPASSLLSILVFIGYVLTTPSQKLASRFFLVSSGRAPPAAF